MKTKKKTGLIFLLLISLFWWSGCEDDEDNGPAQQLEKTYPLSEVNGSGVSGTVTLKKQDAQTTMVTIELSNTQEGNTHPAHIHMNNASEGGSIVVPLSPVDGATGRSETAVTTFNDDTPVTYEELISYDGHVNVHLSADEIATLISQGNIGSNASGSNDNNDDDNNDNGGNNPGGY